MASQSQITVNVVSSENATPAANGPPSTSAPSTESTVLTSEMTISAAKAQTLATGVQQSQSQQANNIEPLDKSSSNTLKVCFLYMFFL